MNSSDPVVRTRVGLAGWEDHRYFGRQVFSELLDRTGLIRLQAQSLGIEITADEAHLMNLASEIVTMADPRVPPLLLGRIVASEGRSISGLCAVLLGGDHGRLGPWAVGRTAEMVRKIVVELGEMADGEDIIAWLLRRKNAGEELPGFGAPFREHDERLKPMLKVIDSAGHRGPHWSMAKRICELAHGRLGFPPNITLLLGGLLVDLGFVSDQVSLAMVYLMMHTFVANVVEGAAQKEDVLRCLPTELIEYRGQAPRESPQAIVSHSGRPPPP